ncbi:MAG TPA: CHASE2 domain-containing protein [Terriglobales bacterium]|nr:CHASE2 domain-containing protein [Terriglobales bacterium]HZW92696.1 CHASE2 domain-containing protein [Candidatus Eremiobacteraceae bacterium]
MIGFHANRAISVLIADLIKAIVVVTFLLTAHAYLDHRPSGTYLRQFQFAFLEEDLKHGPFDDADFEAGGERLPLVVDISKLHADKTRPTDRAQLDLVIDELQRTNAKAIGIDLDFSESDSDGIIAEDYQYLAKWRPYGNVRVGVYRGAMKRRDSWLGRPEFADLAAGIALPKEDPEHGFLYTRQLYDCSLKNVQSTCQEDLIGMPVAMWMISERTGTSPQNALRELEARSTKRTLEAGLDAADFRIDYSYLKEIRKEIITLENASSIQAFRSRIQNRVVLLGDLEDSGDQLCQLPHQKPLSGLLIHACSVATLNRAPNRGMLRELDQRVGWKLRLVIALFVLGGIVGTRLVHAYSPHLSQWDFHYLEILTFAAMSAIIYFVFSWELRKLAVYWPDFFWISLALFLYPFLAEPFYRLCIAVSGLMDEFVLTFVQSGVKR